jgi:hypothetical protein
MALAGAFPLIVFALCMFTPLAIKCPVVFQLDLLPFQVVAVASAVRRKNTSLVVADGASGGFVTYHDGNTTMNPPKLAKKAFVYV